MHGVKPRLLAQSEKAGATCAQSTIQLAKYQPHEGAGLPDDTRLCDCRTDLGHATHYGLLAQDRHQPLWRVNAILEWNNRGVRADEWPDCRAGAFDVPQL